MIGLLPDVAAPCDECGRTVPPERWTLVDGVRYCAGCFDRRPRK